MEKVIFSWVQLSDIHINHGTAQNQLDQLLVLEKLRQDISNAKHRGILGINSVFITGDIASTGDSPNKELNNLGEYEKANLWLASLGQAIGVAKDNIYVVPGNHDVQLSPLREERNLARLIGTLRDQKEAIDDALNHSDDRQLLFSRLKNYMAFAGNYSPYCKKATSDLDCVYWQYKIDLDHRVKLRLIGVNTALLTLGKEDFKKLQLGNSPLAAFIATDPIKINEIVIVLSHHPFDWLYDEANISAWVKTNCHIHLCGHIHSSDAEVLRSGGGSEYIKIVSGAVHGDSGSLEGHGYNICQLVLLGQSLKVRVWPRKWSDKNKDFRRDIDNIPDNTDYSEHIVLQLEQYEIESDDLHPIKCNVQEATNTGNLDTTVPISISINKSHIQACDSPPTSPAWVGREAELDLFNDSDVKVFAVTGIGGQGKSALVARHIENLIKSESDILWDWRDCREEGDTLQTHLLNIIERITEGRISGSSFVDEDITVITEYLFRILSSYSGFFVFDNVDHYIDTSINQPIHGMKLLIDSALSKSHNSQFIFTCRPSMKYDNSQFFEISLSGLSVTDTQKLFELRGVILDQQIKRQVAEAHMLTQGHPLWLNLLATQVAKSKSTLDTLLSDIKNGKNAELPTTIMRSIWKTLNDKQRATLRCMAETVRPESEDQLYKYLNKELNYNQFSRSIKSLKTLALVVIKTAPNTQDTLELHPLVKTFIRCEFPRNERIRYIDNIACYFDLVISKFINSIVNGASLGMLVHWIYRTELAINAAKYADALKTIKDVTDPLLGAGHSEEFTRITKRLFSEMDFTEAVLNEYLHFDEVFSNFVEALSQLGQYSEAELYLSRYDDTVAGKSARYINLCDLYCYYYWSKSEFLSAIEWGKKGAEFKASSNIDTRFEPSHNLALAQRDSGDIEPALVYFLKGHELSEVIGIDYIDDKDGTFYGNIGRCLFLKGDIDSALTCYKKSLYLLKNDSKQHKTTIINFGWAHYWIGEALEAKKDNLLAWSFYNMAFVEWENMFPPKAQLAYNRSLDICNKYPLLINACNNDMNFVESTCNAWLEN